MMIQRPENWPPLVLALGGFFIAVSGLLGGSVGVWDFLH